MCFRQFVFLALLVWFKPAYAAGPQESLTDLKACDAQLQSRLTKRVEVTLPNDGATRNVDCEQDGLLDQGTLYWWQFTDGANPPLDRNTWRIVGAKFQVVQNSNPEDQGWALLADGEWVKFGVTCGGAIDPRSPARRYRITVTLQETNLDAARLRAITRICSAAVLHPGAP